MKTVKKATVSLAVLLVLLLPALLVYRAIVPVGVASATVTIFVAPATSKAPVSQNFIININISNVVDLYGWELRLNWTATILEAKNVVEGPFLKQGGDTFHSFKINNTEGHMLLDCTLLGKVSGVSGNGTLATVEFYVKVSGESVLDLYDTILVNSQKQSITHTSNDGYYYTPIYDVAIINLVASETTVLVTAENQGTETETFDVSTYYTLLMDPLIGTQTITLASGENTSLTFTWTANATGRYEIRAEAPLSSDIDPTDNTRITIIYIGYSGSNPGSNELESINGLHIAGFTFAMFASVIVLAPKKNREIPLFDIPAMALKQNLNNNWSTHSTYVWQDWTRRQPI